MGLLGIVREITSAASRRDPLLEHNTVINAGIKGRNRKSAELTYIVLYNILKAAVNDRHSSCDQKSAKIGGSAAKAMWQLQIKRII